ncbi:MULTISPECIES: YhcN/YlaJ family sporulation lipoprotein [Aneurinibacillus]|uniref:Sporulation lipoprotein YhcN/YlaJ (Spore_YhcN_YlaJ) n=1 Tax=Aneurinibacillus thermoaerophilus TaxID=143495 RepID=A0A1G7YJS5_ANETH|nr:MULTISPECIES: YhcN/YlaJ family sporulation lipoprotein [Aneurinibacillus]AMA73841.1 hypothetical protein ACH33_13895 [Aneurinibacillus sp. XH2]MED0676676.1 YhcN/YlaJ family sporulation lipoprotein [Aneurinibacillus thermoaerophilus]MED0679336.1 YhcN/YlaJ family sporulation lipoprotein [Aneurinibacillus thermoaerophilus]MED0738092.1 YhcN/YlaJ family sporulation lipoprotein [Aneurinibacillus thermoaerophilus]MED0756513.1 YhcN/YlaJ family sporulation lipoprotein [Aneurinibacillus thermoaerophi
MHKAFKQVIIMSLALMMAGSLAACGPRKDGTTKTQSETYRLNQYRTNGTVMDDNFGIRPYGTQQYSLRPDMAYMYPNARAGQYNIYGARPHSTVEQDQKAAERMAQLAANVHGVTRATAIVYDRDAVIGVEGATASNMKMLERSVHEALRRAEPGYTIHVTADKTLTQRIRTLSANMGNKGTNAMRTFGRDITQLIRDIGRSVTAPFR